MMVVLLVGGALHSVWAATVTYHILTLPIDHSVYHTKAAYDGYRLEAIKVVVNNQTTVELPAHYKSPLAENFYYFTPSEVNHGDFSETAQSLYDNGPAKGVLYKIKASPDTTAELTPITTQTAEFYVTYTYNADNTIAKLDGSVNYNIGVKNKGFLSLNRGRNNRPAVVPTGKVNEQMLTARDFSYIANPGAGIGTYWQSGDNKNVKEEVESQFFFGFKFEGEDPYHIVLRTSYAKNITYIEWHEEAKTRSDKEYVYKWYKGGALMANGTGNAYLTSDDHITFTTPWVDGAANPTNPAYTTKPGYFHGNESTWSTLTLLNNTASDGYVLMGTKTVDKNGAVPASPYYMKFTGNNLNFAQLSAAEATKDHTVNGIYPIKKITFKIPTPFYAIDPSGDHFITAEGYVSAYSERTIEINSNYLPASLHRKYCNFTGKFYRDAACTDTITHFSEANYDEGGEGYQVYVGYELTSDIPFKGITPSGTYTDAMWENATWYELTDEASTQIEGLKLKYDGTNFKNNGTPDTYDKTTEFAFIGDPYELRVVYRNTTTGNTVRYVGAEGTSPTTGTALTADETASEGYKWELPADDATNGSFLLRKYKGEGNWYWDAGHPDPVDINYTDGSHASTYNMTKANAQTLTFNVSHLTFAEGNYLDVTVGGTNADQATVQSERIYVYRTETANFTVAVKGRGDGDKQFTLTIQEKSGADNSNVGTAFVVTVNQNNSAIVANTVQYSTASSTRIKVMGLPTRKYTYNIVDLAGNIAAKATKVQTIYSPLSMASIPSVIFSPLIAYETITFHNSYDGTGRGNLTNLNKITELPVGNAASSTNIYVKYTTSHLANMPVNLSENQTFNVRLNEYYVYYDTINNVIKKDDEPTSEELNSDLYLWKLRSRDPYAMLVDNLGARKKLRVADQSDTDVKQYNTAGDGTYTTETRQKGAWIKLAGVLPTTDDGTHLIFDTDRSHAQRFIAKSSTQQGIYEVMVATDDVDADTTYYNIGSPDVNTVKVYNNSTYAHGSNVLKFFLNQNITYKYHLVDKTHRQLLMVDSKSPDLVLPAEYQSPLVATYHYYSKDDVTIHGDTVTVEGSPTELTALSDLFADFTVNPSDAGETYQKTATDSADMVSQARELTTLTDYYFKVGEDPGLYTYYKVTVTRAYRGKDIYVTYDVNDIVKFNTGQYMLKFLDPYAAGYHLEDGNDKLVRDSTIQAVYPYCNGDGNLNIYGNEMQKEQFNGGANTRPRWVWYFESATSDPYHVRIKSKSTISYGGKSHSTYLTTYAVHFNQDADPGTRHIVTGGTLPGVAAVDPMEYMVLGTAGHYQLMTTDSIDNGTTKKRCRVDSLEQYWKTYNMLKLCILNLKKSTDKFSEDPTTWVIPDSLRAVLQDSLDHIGVGAGKWHSYTVYANATRWNGYNDVSSGGGKKVVEMLEHWFQTFKMGDGTFDIESADIPPVLVLLDRHGWEIMRRPLPNETYPVGEEIAGLKVYDSPLVDKYYFYSNATKETGCHKYSLRMQNGKERDQILDNGEHYSSTSLGDLPPLSATGVVDSKTKAIQDFYVTYTVKEEYEKGFSYTFKGNKNDSTYTDSIHASKYLMLQNGRFYKVENNNKADKKSYITKPILEYTHVNGNVYDLIVNPNSRGESEDHPKILDNEGNFLENNFWYVKPNLNIDEEMGIDWVKLTGVTDTAKAKYVYMTKNDYATKTGFDPYNLQIQLVNNQEGKKDDRYLTTHMTSNSLLDGIMIGDYTGSGGTVNITLDSVCKTPIEDEGYDHSTMQITNQTFMAVSDAKGNMQLMPRFDHTLRVDQPGTNPWLARLFAPKDHNQVAKVDDNTTMGAQTTFFVSPQRFHYFIIDNYGREALRYKRGADFYPAITDHFKSPVAKDFTYYTGLAEADGDSTSCSSTDWENATGVYKRTLTQESMFDDAIKLLPDAGTYYYKIGTRGRFKYRQISISKGLLEQQITGSFVEAGLTAIEDTVYVRYEYDIDADLDADRILQGQWYTVKLAGKDLQASGQVSVPAGASQGTGVKLYTGDKPNPVDADAKQWQWKFFVAPADSASDYYVEPDPYAVHLFNRSANYTTNPSLEPSPMSIGIKVPDSNTGVNRFALLSHYKGGYALVVAKEYDKNYRYQFLNGGTMTTPDAVTPHAADTAYEASFDYKFDTISDNAQIFLGDTVKHTFTYMVITPDSVLAIKANQTDTDVRSNRFAPTLPDSAQSPLLNLEDYQYYGFAMRPGGGSKYGVIPQTKLYTLSGLYADTVYVRYAAYDMNKTSFKVPNKRNDTGTGQVSRHENSIDASMNINGNLPYNIIWYKDTIMQSTDGNTVSGDGSHALSGNAQHVWYFTGNDPYSLRIKHKGGKYLNGTTTMVDSAAALPFMLLRKEDYDYGILQVRGTEGANARKKLTFGDDDGNDATPKTFYLTADDPDQYIIFGLSLHDLIYRLIIANTCPDKSNPQAGQYVDIPYRATVSGALDTKRVYGTTQRDLRAKNAAYPDTLLGTKFQLGDTARWNGSLHTYCYDAGSVSIGDSLLLPNIFYRANCSYDFYVEGVYTYSTIPAGNDTPYTAMNNKYQGIKLTKLMSDEELIDQTVVINVVYSFDKDVATNTGLDFVTSTDQNLWYTFETYDDEGMTPYLAQYTNAWGLQSKRGRATHFTNDYLWTPLGDVYGFVMHNRYMLKNTLGGTNKVMTFKSFVENDTLLLAEPGTGGYTSGNEIFELVAGDAEGYFRVHPVINLGETRYYVRRDPSDNYTKLSTTPCDWRFGLDTAMLEPYYIAAGYVGGLTDAGKVAYDTAVAHNKIMEIQDVVYNDDNIVKYKPGYYRLHNQPGVSGISPVRYASGYLHKSELTGDGEIAVDTVPMHFYSREGVSATYSLGENPLLSGFTTSKATRGELPIDPTEQDPSTIFYFDGTGTLDGNPRSTIQTQGLYVAADANGDAEKGVGNSTKQRAVMSTDINDTITFSIMDIGGAVVLIHDGAAPKDRRYLNFDQTAADSIYDLKFYHNVPTDDAKWCMQPVQKKATAGNGEKPLEITTNKGGDDHYYATFYAPFDVLLPNDKGDTTYNAYICTKWYDDGVHPTPVPAHDTIAEGKFVPANTPVIIRVKDEGGEQTHMLTLTLPNASPSTPVSCIFSGSHLEQKLDEATPARIVYTLGVPMTSEVTGFDQTTGEITAPLPTFASTGVGFYINATPNKESEPTQSLWKRNNLYVQHNKIYYREGESSGARAPKHNSGVEFVPVIFGDEDEHPESPNEGQGQQRVSDGCVYDILGRKVATAQEVKDGAWYQSLAPGIYIVNGQKIYIH